MSHGPENDSVLVPLAALERLLEKRRAESVAAVVAPTPGPEIVLRVGETTLYEAEKELITRTLAACSGHRGQTCSALGISRPTLVRKLRAYKKDESAA